MPGLDREMDAGNFRRHSSCCYRIHGHIRGVIDQKPGTRRESRKKDESQHRNRPAVRIDFHQMNFPDRTAAMEDNRLDQQPVNLTCT